MSLPEIREATTSDTKIISSLAKKIWPICFQQILTQDQIDNMLQKIYGILSLPPKTGQKTPAKLRSIEDVKYLEYGDINEPDKRNKKNI